MTERLLSAEQLWQMTDEQLLSILAETWEVKDRKFKVWGSFKLFPDAGFAFLKSVRVLNTTKILSYPIEGKTADCAFYIPEKEAQAFGDVNKFTTVQCELRLAPLRVRRNHNIPFEMRVVPGSVEPLKKLPEQFTPDVIRDEDKAHLIPQSIYDFYLHQEKVKVHQALQSYEKERKQKLASELSSKESMLSDIQGELLKAEKALDAALHAQSSSEERKRKINEEVDRLKKESLYLNERRDELISELTIIEDKMTSKIDRLKEYIVEQTNFLLKLGLVDHELIDDLNSAYGTEKNSSRDGLSFEVDFNGDYEYAVSYIHAYLFEKDILYPRHVIENFLTLLRTGDLIVLAGDSGSGKTNLVHSFANAVGGKSIIIPVKPNWTSSEDLLGYYNPLEKKYLSTPFLEALIEAKKNPQIPYFICLDEMNLARVEYYFADFLSLLESRDSYPEITLYTADESSHVLSELRAVLEIIGEGKKKHKKDGVVDFIEILKDNEFNYYLRSAFGLGENDSLLKYHGEIRRMIASVIEIPSKIKMPANVHLVGAINIDETTHYLSPKILDRAHIMRFDSPLLSDWDQISRDISDYGISQPDMPLLFSIEELGVRKPYPRFDREDKFCAMFTSLNKEFFHKLGIEFGMRTIRQGLNYLDLYSELNDGWEEGVNNFILYKLLPKFTFDGSKSIDQQTKLDLLERILLPRLKEILPNHLRFPKNFSAIEALSKIIDNAKVNDGLVNYWS